MSGSASWRRKNGPAAFGQFRTLRPARLNVREGSTSDDRLIYVKVRFSALAAKSGLAAFGQFQTLRPARLDSREGSILSKKSLPAFRPATGWNEMLRRAAKAPEREHLNSADTTSLLRDEVSVPMALAASTRSTSRPAS